MPRISQTFQYHYLGKIIIQISTTKFLLWLKKTHLLYGRKHDTSRKKVWLTLVSRVLSTTKKIRQNTGGVTQWLKYILNLYRKRPQAQPVMIRRIFCGHVLERARTRFPPSPSAKPKGHKDPWKINLQIRIGQIFLLKKNTFGHFGPNLRGTNWDFERFFQRCVWHVRQATLTFPNFSSALMSCFKENQGRLHLVFEVVCMAML